MAYRSKNSNLKWEVPAWAASPQALDQNLLIPMGDQDTLSIIDSSALESHDDEELTLIRLVGSIRMSCSDANGGLGEQCGVKARLHVGMEVDNMVPVYADPWSAQDAEEEFLWERTYDVRSVSVATNYVDWEQLIGVGNSPPARGDSPYWSEIDIQIKRTIRPPFVIGLTFAPRGRADNVLRVWAWLRALIAR